MEKDKTEFDVCEIFSRPRVCQVAKDLGLRGGYSLNRETKDMHTNKSWSFMEKKDQVKLITLVARRPTQLLIASPPCKLFSPPQMNAKSEMTQEDSDQGVLLLHVAVRAWRLQMKSGRHFIFEHPRDASSWTDPELVALMQVDSVEVVELDQRMHGLTSTDEIGSAPAEKGTRLLTNMQAAHVVVSKCCNHEHTHRCI